MARTNKREPTTTSNRSDRSKRSGFTLIEILIVLAIIATVMAIGLPAISRITYQKINSTTRKFVGLIRTVRNDSILLTNIYRIAFDLDKNTWWVEGQRELRSLEPPPSNKIRRNQDQPPPSNFQIVEKYSKKPVPMPEGVAFVGILKEDLALQTKGISYIHFFPNGFNEQAILYIARRGDQPGKGYSIVIRATSGRVEILPKFVQSFDLQL